jgi:hypothetical protein
VTEQQLDAPHLLELSDLKAAQKYKKLVTRQRLADLTADAPDVTLFTLAPYAIDSPRTYFDRDVAQAVLDTLEGYAQTDESLLESIFKETALQIDTAFHHLRTINEEVDDGTLCSDTPGQVRLVDSVFLNRHLRLVEYVLDHLTLPLVAFLCETEQKSWRDFQASNRLGEHLPRTGAARLAEHWRPVARNGIAHGRIRHTETGLELSDRKGRQIDFTYADFVWQTDRLQDACNGIAVAYISFFTRRDWQLPVAIAREVISATVDDRSFRITHLVDKACVDGARQLDLHIEHRLLGSTRIIAKTLRALLAAFRTRADFDRYAGSLTSRDVLLSFIIADRDDLAAYDRHEIDFGQLFGQCVDRSLIWPAGGSFPRLRQRWREWLDLARDHREIVRFEQDAKKRLENELPAKLINVEDCSVGNVRKRIASAYVDSIHGQTHELDCVDLANQLLEMVTHADVELEPKAPRVARGRGRLDRAWIRVFARPIRARATSCGFKSPYLLTIEYSADETFPGPELIGHKTIVDGRFRLSILMRDVHE